MQRDCWDATIVGGEGEDGGAGGAGKKYYLTLVITFYITATAQ